MKKISKIKLGLLLAIIFALVSCDVVLAAEVLNPNYGTTTFFSDKNEAPSDNPPVYDVGAKAGKKSSKDTQEKKDSSSNNTGGLFNQIVSGVGNFFGSSESAVDSEEESLFDLQSSSDSRSLFGDSQAEGDGSEFIMGARGESLENMTDEEVARYNSRISSGFNFRDNGASSAPKKSKLLFTNIIIPVNMTTQYVLVGFVFFISIGLVVGYYFWKKESARDKKYSADEDYQ